MSVADVINCMAETHSGRCARCMTCRIVRALENMGDHDAVAGIARHVDRIGDELGVISEYVERL